MAAKLRIPSVQPWVIERPRLLEIFSRGSAGPLTLVSAPAGSGKTVLASSWAAKQTGSSRIAWVSLDEEDVQPGLLWSYVIAGLAQSGVPVTRVGVPDQTGTVERSLLVRLAACLWEQPQRVVLVLDNAQFLTSDEIGEEIDFLIRHAGPQLGMVMLTRRDPPLRLHRYRLSGSLTEVRLGQLSFTPAEVHAMLASHGVVLPDAAASALADRTRGWAAALRLAILAHLPPCDTGWLLHPDYDQGPIADYLNAEVLDTQPADVRRFLLLTSVVDRLWPSLAVALTGYRDALRRLTNLSRSGTFLAPSEELPGSYEYHPLVRDLLRARLQAEAPAELPELHRAAAAWLVENGEPAAAIPHAAAAGDWEDAAALMVETLTVGRLVGPDVEVGAALAGMPADVPGPAAATVLAAMACAQGDPETCAKHLLRARELVGDEPSDDAWAQYVAVGVIEAVCGSVRGDVEATLAAASAVDAMLSEAPSDGVDVSELRAVVLWARAGVLLMAGRLDEAAAAASDVLRASDKPGCEHLRVAVLGRLALVEALRGRLNRAADRAQEAVALAERLPPAADRTAVAEVALAWVEAEHYDIPSAVAHADRASLAGKAASEPVAAGMLALVRTRLSRARGDLTNASAELSRVTSRQPTDMPPWLHDVLADHRIDLRSPGARGAALAPPADGVRMNPWRVLLRAWAMVAVADTVAASDVVAPLRQQTDLPVDVQVGVWLVTAMGHLAEGRRDLARDALDRGLELAEPEQLRRPILEAPGRLRRFLRQDSRLAERHQWLTRSRARQSRASAAVVDSPPQPIVEALTTKEREVLRHLASLLSTDEIARAMLVSVNTVKTHVRGVLRKLAVSRRNDAVRRARELGLI